MKIATDIAQSKKLAEFLPIESSDMLHCLSFDGDLLATVPKQYSGSFRYQPELTIPCWSLAALLNVLPKQIGRYTKTLYWFDDAWHCEYVDEESEGKYGETAVNPVDACVEMIIKLKEDNLL